MMDLIIWLDVWMFFVLRDGSNGNPALDVFEPQPGVEAACNLSVAIVDV